MQDDDAEVINKLCRSYRQKKHGFKQEELLKIAPVMIMKCYNTIEMIYREILTEAYWRIEYD